MLTGNKDLDFKILGELEDKDLVSYCRTNKQADEICKDQGFWLNRIMLKFPYLSLEILNKYKGDRSWSEYYINDLREINRVNADDYLIKGSTDKRYDHVMIAIDNGANVHIESDFAVKMASYGGRLDIVKYLVNNGANIRTNNDIPVRWASGNGYLDVVRYLVSQGADITLRMIMPLNGQVMVVILR